MPHTRSPGPPLGASSALSGTLTPGVPVLQHCFPLTNCLQDTRYLLVSWTLARTSAVRGGRVGAGSGLTLGSSTTRH